jgi:hypothetical protein
MNANYKVLGNPLLLFGTDAVKQHWDIRAGLAQLYPFDYNTATRRFSSIRLSILATSDKFNEVLHSLSELSRKWQPKRWGYPYRGFESIYKAPLDLPKPSDTARIGLIDPKLVETHLAQDDYDQLVHDYWVRIHQLHTRGKPDVLVAYAPELVEKRYNVSARNFRASIKARCIEAGIKTQLLSDSALNPNPYDRCERVWDLSLGLYVKAGGIPWKSDVVQGSVCFIGITFGIQEIGEQQVTLIGLAEVFDQYADHLGIRLVQDRLPREDFYSRITEEGLYLSQEKAEVLVHDALVHGYQQAKSGAWPSQIIIHKTSPFVEQEVAGMLAAANDADLNLVHFQSNSNMRVHSEYGGFPPDRGLFWEYDPGRAALLYTNGKVKTYRTDRGRLREGSTYFGGGSASPVEIERAYGALKLEDLAEQVVSLTKMNWNSTRPANSEPITVDYARKVVPLLKAGLRADRLPRDVSFYI